ncbi:hypothetical protein IQ249_16530 [Lusitaniella coriacea LEGE 07157]|uniref:DUF6745 domain-containing protein n=1 Tax=Lusitaniella coriacea LEGE 07157 TaxID=945747 RepID=A0A8J7DYC6_9CYAN|nr:hypothetical protein [Lusitaniella coriacea]MBE9117507.1 hypothetical protein [Lusitaniella coriacea LEGE 07157]
MKKFSLLTPEQEELISQYQEKWQDIQLSTEPIDRQRAENAVKEAYSAMRKKIPEIVFCDSPHAAMKLKAQSSKASQPKKAIAQPTNSEHIRFSSPTFLRFWAIFFGLIWSVVISVIMLLVISIGRKVTQARDSLSRLQKSLSQSTAKQWKKKFESLTPKNLNTQEIVEQSVQGFSAVFPDLQERLGEQEPEDLKDSFTTTATNVEQQLSWLPAKKTLFRWWFGNVFISTTLAKIQGTNHHPVDAQIQMRLLAEMPKLFQQNPAVFMPQSAAIASIGLDFSTSVLNFSIDEKKWQALQSLVRECGWIFSFRRQLVICDRARKINLDDENRLHAEGEPAIQFADGFSIYAHHGVTLPEKYGQLHPEQWEAKWLLEERNAELRRVLIQGIGYARLCQDLDAIELDSWEEYTLLKIENDVDVEPIHLLKMTCPSTAYIHAARVPPNVQSAREAIRWVNWDTDPEAFSQQT